MNSFLLKCIEQGLPVVLDYDGVMFEARWDYDTINVVLDDDKLLELNKNGLGVITAPIPFVIDWINTLKNPVFCLSHIKNDYEEATKDKQIKQYCPKVKLIRAHHVDEKLGVLANICSQYGGFVYVDDTLPYVAHFESVFDNPNGHFFHVSSLYV